MSDRPPPDSSHDDAHGLSPVIALQQDLRAPLDAIAGYAYLLLDECAESSRARAPLRAVLDNVDRLLDIVMFPSRSGDPLRTGSTGWTREHREEWRQLTSWIAGDASDLLARDALADVADSKQYLEKMEAAARDAAGTLGPGGSVKSAVRVAMANEDIAAAATAVLRESHPESQDEPGPVGGTVLVADDDSRIREILTRFLRNKGHRVVSTANGRDALSAMQALAFDAVLLDVLMPEMDGFTTLRRIKEDPGLEHVPVIMLSGDYGRETVARCLALGADDYLRKPFDPIFLVARLTSSIEKKRLRDRDRASHERLLQEQKRSHDLLLNILPESVARRLEYGQKMIANHFESVTVLFCDLVSFTQFSSSVAAPELVQRLNRVFHAFDDLVVEHGAEKIKTIGDAYLAVAGLPEACSDHAHRAARLALAMLDAARGLNESGDLPLHVRIGLHSGPVTAGVIGKLKFAYDIWGDTVNVASRMESAGVADAIQVSEPTHALLEDSFRFESRAPLAIKGKGQMRAWLLHGPRDDVRAPGGNVVPIAADVGGREPRKR